MDKSEHAAIRGVLSGDKKAFEVLVVRHTARLFRVAFRITGNEADAEDVLQETFLLAYRKLSGFEIRSDFGTWIYRIAVNCALKKIGGSSLDADLRVAEQYDPEQSEIQVADMSAGPERLLLSHEIGTMQEFAMRSLTPIERAAFVLRHVEECSCEEIGTALQIAPNTAKQAVFRAVHKLRRRLAVLRVKV